jgi:pSer/pThr/pTyr-binding forkhead associated (FHA) protein
MDSDAPSGSYSPDMALSVQVRSNDAGVPAVTFDAPRIVVGRSQGCDVRLPDASVSRRHASIRQRGAEYVILDEGSSNGTFVGRVKLAPGAPHVIRSGDVVRCGLVELELKLETATATPNAPQLTREIALMLISGALASDGKRAAPYVVAHGGADDGVEFSLEEAGKAYVVGRGPQSDFDLSDEDVSRRHVELTRKGGEVWVKDLGAKNPVHMGSEVLSRAMQRWDPRFAMQLSATTTLELRDPLSETLLQIEAAPDEIVEDLREPSAERPTTPSHSTTETDAGDEADEPAPRAAVVGRTGSEKTRHWTFSDVMVGLLALLILGCSILGMAWLVRS